MFNEHLIIFTRNLELGKVKSRLAATIGDEKALLVYKELLTKTRDVAQEFGGTKKVYYSDFVENSDLFEDQLFEKHIQHGEDLGERMYNAFKECVGEWANKVVLIGADCYELTFEVISKAFVALEKHDYVLGPAEDGGYYLIGMREASKAIFEEKDWGTENVLLDTLLDIQQSGKSHYLLPTLNDVDTEEDLPGELRNLEE